MTPNAKAGGSGSGVVLSASGLGGIGGMRIIHIHMDSARGGVRVNLAGECPSHAKSSGSLAHGGDFFKLGSNGAEPRQGTLRAGTGAGHTASQGTV